MLGKEQIAGERMAVHRDDGGMRWEDAAGNEHLHARRRERGSERNWILRRNHLLGSLWKGPCPTYRLQRQARRKEESSRFSHVKLASSPVHHSPSASPSSFSMALHLVKKATQGSIINLVGLSQRRVCRINAKSIRWPPARSFFLSFLFSFFLGWDI